VKLKFIVLHYHLE